MSDIAFYDGFTHWNFIKNNFYHLKPDGEIYLTYEDVIKRAMQMYIHRDWYAYLYGCDGQVCYDGLVDKMVEKYPNHFKDKDIQAIKDYSRNKVVFDCSGFIHSIYNAPDKNSAGIISDCSNITEDLASGVEASVLYKRGHIGQDVGHGCFIHIANELQTFRLEVIREYNWTHSGMWSRYCDYTGATAD